MRRRDGLIRSSTSRLAAWACVWKDRPRHDDASHGADAFLTFDCSSYQPLSAVPTRKRSFGWVV